MATTSAPALDTGLNARLSIMMFLQYAIWGAWLPIIYSFLTGHRGFSDAECGTIIGAGAIGAVVGPFVAGQIADRWFPTQRFLALSHVIGAGLVWQLAAVETYQGFLVFSIVYGLVYSPTLALTNSLTLHHIPDRDRDFGKIRLWGTVGWIVAGVAVGQWLLFKHTPEGTDEVVKAAQDAGRADAFRGSAVLGLLMGVYCWFLPHTPPARDAREANASLKALGEVRYQPLLTLFLLAVPISCVHQFYFVFTGEFLSQYGRDAANAINQVLGVGGGGLMTIGQMSEIVVLALIPLFAKSVSRKTLLGIGLAAYAARMALFAYTDSLAPVLLGVAMHGLCFGCFVFVAFMVVDENTDADVRASAQNLFNLVIIGVGVLAGSWIAGQIGAWARVDGVRDWTKLFAVPMWAALASLVALLAFYPGGSRSRAA
ncbi:MAG: MFS transporter [Planctomycetota bacterium]